MKDVMALLSNYVLITALIAWGSAQVLKAVINALLTGRVSLVRMLSDGGMPSCHSACVCALALAISRKLGFASPEFGLALIFAMITMNDAMGVRRAAGEHARVLNKMIEEDQKVDIDYFDDEASDVSGLREYRGHTPLEVLCGALLGIIIAMIIPVF